MSVVDIERALDATEPKDIDRVLAESREVAEAFRLIFGTCSEGVTDLHHLDRTEDGMVCRKCGLLLEAVQEIGLVPRLVRTLAGVFVATAYRVDESGTILHVSEKHEVTEDFRRIVTEIRQELESRQ